MEPLKHSTDCGKPNAKPKKKEPSTVGNSQASLPSLWPVPYSPKASSLRRSLFDPAAIIAVTDSPVPVAQAGSMKVSTESRWKERLSGASLSCTNLSDEAAKSLTDKDEFRVTIRDLFSLPAIIVGASSESSCSTVEVQLPELKWTEKLPKKASATCTNISVKTADEAAQSFTEKDASRVTRRDLFNLSAIGPTAFPGSPRVAGSRKATAEIKWTEKPRQKPLLSCADIPVTVTDEAAAAQKATLVEKVPITGMEIVQFFIKERDVGELKVFYLKEQECDLYRPYDLRVVQVSEAGSEHYVFTVSTVLHVTQRGYGGLVSLDEWHRESVLWTALRAIPFFRDFILRNAVTLWYKNVRKIVYNRRSEEVQALLLTKIPQYRNGLLLLSRRIEELKVTHLLPLDESKTYTLSEFQRSLATCREKVLNSLRQLSELRISILNKAKEKSYKVLKELQEHLSYAELPHHCCKPMHLHQAHLTELQGDLAHADSILQKLGNFAALVNHLIVQSLVTVIQKNLTLFLSNVLKREYSHCGCLFQMDLRLVAGRLTLDPPLHSFRETIAQALLTAGDSISQMCDTCGFFLEISSTHDCQDETSDLDCSPYAGVIDTEGEVKDDDGMPALLRYSCCHWIREQRPLWKSMTTVQGHKMPFSYYPLSKEQLVWYITTNDVAICVNTEHSQLMQAAECEIQRLLKCYTWLLDVRVFISQWSPASLENMKGQPASLYQELITKLRQWIEQMRAAPSFISTSNQLFIIHCTHIKENLGQQLSLIENEVQEELVKQLKLCSESFLQHLEESLATLRTEPKDLHDLPKYVDVVWKSMNMLAEMQKRLEYNYTLRDSICIHYREMTNEELNLEKKMLDMWDCYNSHLKQADGTLRSRLPTVATALYTMFPWMASDLRSIVCNATSGLFLDPRQNAEHLASELNYMSLRVGTASSNLEQLSKTGDIFEENPVDLTDLTDIPKLIARKELWDLTALYRRCLHEWNTCLFTELALTQAQEQIAHWQQQVAKLSHIIPAGDAVLRETSETINDLSCRLKILAKFRGPTIKPKHRTTFFKGLGLWHASDKNATLAQLIYQPFGLHQELINKICSDAQKENSMEQTFQKIQQAWTNRIFQLQNCTGPCWHLADPQILTKNSTSDASCDAKTIIGLEFLFSEIETDLMTMTNMHSSRHSVDFRSQVEEWMHLLQELEKLLHLFEIYQQKWIFLTKIFQERTLGVQRWDLLTQFRSVDERFKTMMCHNSAHPDVLNLVRPKTGIETPHGGSLCEILLNEISTLNALASQMANRLHSRCKLFPRLYFLSDREVVELLSLQPTPTSLLPFVRKFFKGVQSMDVEEISGTADGQDTLDIQTRVLGVFGNFQEHIIFLSPLEPNHNLLIWLSTFQDQLKFTMEDLLRQCADERKQLEPSTLDASHKNIRGHVLPVLEMTAKYPLQCLLVAEETVWCNVLNQAFQESSTIKMSAINAFNKAQLANLCRSLRDAVARSRSDVQLSKYTMACLRALVLLRIQHAEQLTQLMQVQCQPGLSFEWLSSLKYYVNSTGQSPKETDGPKCYVDILGRKIPYGYEYFGPEEFGMVHTPCTDRVIMGILLAVTSYRCGFVNGPCSSGKTNTVVRLGKALGRNVVMLHCCPNMSPDIFQKMLLGALMTGAWFVLDSVDLLPQGVQASLAQQLEDIYQSFFGLSVKSKDEGKSASGSKSAFHSEYCTVFSGISVSASLNYGSVVISSKECSSELSQSLRFSTRPVALTCPDHRIIVEIMLTSFGFKEAKCLSQRLVSLISLSKDSLCLPVFLTQNQSSHLVILQNITSASKKLFKQFVRHEKFSGKARRSFVIRTILKSPENEHADDINEAQEQAIFSGLLEEIAVVKAIHSVLSPFMYVSTKASQFNSIFKELFPIASQLPFIQQYTQDEPNYKLEEAVSEELDQLQLHSNAETICQALTLYHTLSFSRAVVLLGPSGSGKTTCYNALAAGLTRLANKTGENTSDDNKLKSDTPQAKLQSSVSNWISVNTVVLFPNAMSHEELFGGFCEKTGWQDGAVTKALRDSERHKTGKFEMCKTETPSHETKAVKWLVMDGEPPGKPCWLDHLSTLSDLENPFLSVPSGETLIPSQSLFKLIVETTDLSNASPSAVTRCSLIYFTGTDVWDSVWKSEMDSFHIGFTLDQATLEMWTQLSEDLFSSTLSLLKKNNISNKGQPSTYGLVEITSFIRILRALLEHFAKKHKNKEAIAQKAEMPPGRDSDRNQDLFVLAYIWGFGGHLHPRLWPQFDIVARQVLLDSRSKIVVPPEGTVFEFFFNIDNQIYSNNTLLTKSITPKYWKYTCLLSVMLEAIQPVLLSGEPGSGKSTVCNALLCFDKPHIKVPASSIQGPADLRHLLCGISYQKSFQKTKGVMTKQPGLLLYVDDLHETPRDVTGKTSKILETLRQSVSKGGVLALDSDHFKVLSPGVITYLATCCVFELDNPHVSVISSRLSRLFSIFALPSLTTEFIFSIHSPQLKLWIRDVPFIPNVLGMVRSIIHATENLYEDVCKNFQPTRQSPHFLLSHHDLKKVFEGMCLWQPVLPKIEPLDPKLKSKCSPVPQEPLAIQLNIVHLWIHECMRTFGDRINSEDERNKLQSLITKTATAHFTVQLRDDSNLDDLFPPGSARLTAGFGTSDTRTPRSPAQGPKSVASTESNASSRQTKFLQHLMEAVTKLTYGPELVGNHFPVFKRSSYQPQDLNVMIQHLLAHIDLKDNEIPEAERHFAFKYAVHRQRICQMLHIFRALLIPGGHGLLMASGSGTGRKTTVRLAASVSGSHLMEVHAGNESELNRILKQAGNRTRVYEINTIILVHENISSSVREELLVALRSYPGLYTDQELANLVSRVTAVYKTKRFLLDSWIFDKYLCQNLRDVHVFILMPAVVSANSGNNQYKAQMNKALGLCCVEMYQPWFNRSLAEAAAHCLKNIYHNLEIQGSQDGLAVAMAGIHQSAYQYASVLLTAQPFSPYTFMAFISHFGYLCKVMLSELESRSKRLNTGLSHLDALDNTAMKYKQELMRMQGIVAEIQQRVDELLGAINDQKTLLHKAEKNCAKQERKIQILEDRIAESENELSPFFQAALDVLHSLDPLDLEEVRHYRDPPDGVVLVMDAVLLLFDRPSGWANAKKLFGQCNLYKCLETFDFYSLTDIQMLQLGELIQNPLFVPECIREVSNACETLCRWILAVNNCGSRRYQLMVRKQLDLMLVRAQDQLEQIKDYMGEIHRCLEELGVQLQPVQELLDEQLVLLHKAECLERNAANAVKLLLKHTRVWRAEAQDAQLQRQCLPGDAMVLAAIISYLGPFAADVRTELLSKWRVLCQTGIIDANPTDPRSSLFTSSDPATAQPMSGFPVTLSGTLQPLLCRVLGVKDWPPHETATTRLVLKLMLWGCRRSWVKYWPLLADTKHHLEINSKNGVITGETGDDVSLGKEFECDIVVCADDPKLMCHLDLAAEKGLKILVTHIERVSVSPEFLATLARPAASRPPGSKPTAHQTHPQFCLLLSTHYPARLLSSAIHPSVLAQVDVVDLSPSSDQIQELMLTQLLQSECKVLLIQHLRRQNDKQLLQKKLVTEEDSVMDSVLQSDTTRMQAPEFLTQVAEVQESMSYVRTELQLVDERKEFLEPLLAAPQQLIKLAWLFYQALQELSHLSPAYYFPLSAFMAVMQEAFAEKASRLVSYGTGKVMGGVIPEIRNKMVAKLMFYYRPCLFRSHGAVFKLLVTLAVMHTNQLCSLPERTAFLLGFKDILVPPALHSPKDNRISPEGDSDLLVLERIPDFTGLTASLTSSRNEWRDYLRLPSTVITEPVPCGSHRHLSLMQRALLLKTLHPHSTEELAEAMAACQFRIPRNPSVPHCGNPGALYKFLVEHKGPIILTWPCPSKDKWTSINPLHLVKLLASKATETKEVKVIFAGGLCDQDFIIYTLEKTVRDGHWLVFNNCHLVEHWDAKLVARFNQLFSPFGATKHINTPHPDFRVWFLTEETTQSFLPASVRLHGLPLACDSSWTVKEELSCSLQYLSSVAQCHSENLADSTQLLLRCATFHSVLVQREAYKYLGQARIYGWSQSDLLALADVLISSASLCHDKRKALQYIAVHLVHGGHVLESVDSEVLQNTAETCFSAAPPLASGPHMLANVIISTELRDFDKIQRILLPQLLRGVDMSEPLLLGFSADVEAEIVKINSHNLNKMLQASQTPQGLASCSRSGLAMLPELSQATERLRALQDYLTHQNEIRSRNSGAVFQSPLYDFLLAEWHELSGSVSSLLSRLQQPLRYMTATFLSLPTLTALSRMQRRAELLSAYLWRDNNLAPRAAYRLSAFANAKGFLVALRRKAAQVHHKYISDIALQIEVRDDPLFTPRPKDIVDLCDLELRGASWDVHRTALQNSLSPQPCPMPLICIRAQVKDAHFPRPLSADQVYHCPIYLEDLDTGEEGRDDFSIVTKVPLPSELEPSLCSLRKVRLVSRLCDAEVCS